MFSICFLPSHPGIRALFSSAWEMEVWGDNKSFTDEKKATGVWGESEKEGKR